ncbi:MAG: hypothetical protein E7425_09245 [Ruminococcaceae bacterium]|nr:hypothetical protein [Oscillospiraceae bacterium]
MTICCEDCVYYDYDEEYDEYACERAPDLDEDEMASFLERRRTACPFYRPGNADYYLSGKQ